MDRRRQLTTSTLEAHEFRTGGRFRFVQQGEDGEAYAFNGVYHVVRDNEFAIQTFEFEGYPDVVSIESITSSALTAAGPGCAGTRSTRRWRPATAWSAVAWRSA